MGFTTSFEGITSKTDPYKIPRVVVGNYDLEDFKSLFANTGISSINCPILSKSLSPKAIILSFMLSNFRSSYKVLQEN